jgi:hypothetical protein
MRERRKNRKPSMTRRRQWAARVQMSL